MKNRSTHKNLFQLKWSLAIVVLLVTFGTSHAATIDVSKHGADNTGQTKTSAVINSLIDSLTSKGGGTLYFPAGTYFCGPIVLKSNITLDLDAGATLLFSDDFEDYLPMVQSRWEDVRVKTFISPIYARGASNISITGRGHIEGQGKKWWDYWYKVNRENINDCKYQKMFDELNAATIQKSPYLQKMKHFLRPSMILFYECSNILIEGISMSNPPFWTIQPTFSENITIHNITIENPGESPNTDGIDPSSCRNVHISDCHISVGDDCIVIKSGRDEDGREAAMPTENITITNCTMLNGHGGVVIGSEMSGSVRRVTISNCVFEGTDRGIRFKTMRGRGGVVEDIRISNIVMRNIVNEGIVLNMRYQPTEPEPVSERTPQLRRIHISNVSITDAVNGIAIYGLEEMNVDQVTFSDVFIQTEKGINVSYAKNLIFDNIRLDAQTKNPLVFDNSHTIQANNIQLLNTLPETTMFSFDTCSNVKISDCFQTASVETFLKTSGKTERFYLTNNILPGVKQLGVTKKSSGITLLNNLQ